MRSIVFSNRTIKEILRDPISYIFCLGFPLLMLIIMTVVNQSIPAEAGMVIFRMQNLAPGIAFFGFSFVMIFAAIQVSSDRSTALLTRLHASPMKSVDFILGYTVPMLVIGLLQLVVSYVSAIVIGAVSGDSLNIGNLLLSVVSQLPGLLMFTGFGLLFGTVLSEKAAPGICSVIVTVSGMLGGVWMPVDTMGGTILKIAKVLPFYRAVTAARLTVNGSMSESWVHFLLTLAWAAGIYVLAVIFMAIKLKED